jgi:glucose-1-phosphate adenylyltransferase
VEKPKILLRSWAPGFSYVSMGNYIFEREALEEALIEDAGPQSTHDFGKDIFPRIFACVA